MQGTLCFGASSLQELPAVDAEHDDPIRNVLDPWSRHLHVSPHSTLQHTTFAEAASDYSNGTCADFILMHHSIAVHGLCQHAHTQCW